jgi:hypothetical protein
MSVERGTALPAVGGSRSATLARMWPIIIIVVVLVPLLVLAWIRVRQR